jgi:hypothetical protein
MPVTPQATIPPEALGSGGEGRGDAEGRGPTGGAQS